MSSSWKSDNSEINNPKSFLFTLTNIHNTKPTKFPSKDYCKIKFYSNKGPSFGFRNPIYTFTFMPNKHDILVGEDFIKFRSCSDFPNYYEDALELGNSIFSSDEKSNTFQIIEIEVFKLFK